MKGNRPKIYWYFPIILAVVLIIGIYIGNNLVSKSVLTNSVNSLNFDYSENKLGEIMSFIEKDYVDEVDKEKLTEKAIAALIKELDPHTSYIPKEDFNTVNDPLLGSFEGIGIQFNVIEDTIAIIHVIKGGPSEKSGLMDGDRITHVNDSLIAGVGINSRKAIKLLKGPRGSNVKVSVLRKGVADTINYNIERNVIPTFSLDIAYMVNDSIGYIKLNNFAATTHDEFKKAGKELKEKGAKSIILDLRSNTGGYIRPATRIVDEFLTEDKLIVYTKGNNRPKRSQTSKANGMFESEELVILINQGSASASEIVAGAIQDNDRGVIIGRRSFGKGLVQEQKGLKDGSALRLTTARYYTPTGRSIQKSYDENFDDYFDEIGERFANGEFFDEDSIKLNDSLIFKTPGGKTVYGGGGIMPDIFVPVEKDNPKFYNIVNNKGLVYRFAFKYADKHREELNLYEGPEAYVNSFEIEDKVYNEFAEFVKSNGVDRKQSEIKKSKEKLTILLKAYIGRNIFNDEAFYPVIHQSDSIFIKAKEFLVKQ